MNLLDETVAREVAQQFLGSTSRPRDPMVKAAYSALEVESDRAFANLTIGRGVAPLRVAFTGRPEPYSCALEMIEAVRSTSVLEVVTNERDRDRPHPLLDNERGGAYDRFRAVHDLLGHVRNGLGFDRQGEYEAWRSQEPMYSPLARLALATELHGEHSVRWTTGQFAEHKAMLLSLDLLCRARRGRGSSRVK